MQDRSSMKENKKAVAFPTTIDGKNAAAVMLGRLGGLKGGRARAEKLSSSQRSAIARKAAISRWENQE
jgi:hypothetical protein